MKPKVLITTKDGIVQSVDCNMDMDIIIVDYDEHSDEESVIISGPSLPDNIFTDGQAHQMFTEETEELETFVLSNEEKFIKQYLKDHNF